MPARKRHKRVPQTRPLPTTADVIADLIARATGTPRRHIAARPATDQGKTDRTTERNPT